jgi:hypothetical protein
MCSNFELFHDAEQTRIVEHYPKIAANAKLSTAVRRRA